MSMENNKNQIGRNALIVAVIGLVLVQGLLYYGLLENKFWHVLLSGFEAATVGGIADWFAVSALFHEIPIPLVSRHTNIIVKNRGKLTEGVVDLVTKKWLSPEIIKEKISDVPIVEKVLQSLKAPQNNQRILVFIREVTGRITSNLDDPDVTKILQNLLKDQLKDIDLGAPLGNWLKKSIEQGEHHQVWEILLEAAEKTIQDEATRASLTNALENLIKEYKEEGWLKKLMIKVSEITGAIDNASIVDKAINSMEAVLKEAKNNPSHAIRKKFDAHLLRFAENLIIGDPETSQLLNGLKHKLAENAASYPIIQGILAKFKTSITAQLSQSDSPVVEVIKRNLDKVLLELETDPSMQKRMDSWIKDSIEQLVVNYHHEIGEMVRMSLSRLNDLELVGQIEEKVGNDLQYIRLNGALVGGFVGLVIALFRLLLG
ncbi:DUF445 family protein [Echinicola sediminis]